MTEIGSARGGKGKKIPHRSLPTEGDGKKKGGRNGVTLLLGFIVGRKKLEGSMRQAQSDLAHVRGKKKERKRNRSPQHSPTKKKKRKGNTRGGH